MRITKDLMKVDTIIAPIAVGTTGTGQVGRVIDRRGYRGVNLVFGYGSITATSSTFTVVIKEGSVTSAMTSVADADLIGTEALAGLGAAVRTDFVGDRVFRRVSYIGMRRYVSANIISTVTAGAPVSCVAVLTDPEQAPIS